MSTVLFEKNETFDPPQGRVVLTRSRWLQTDNGSLVYDQASKLRGTSGTGKTWSRWRNDALVTVRPTAHGYLLVTRRTHGGGRSTIRHFIDGPRRSSIDWTPPAESSLLLPELFPGFREARYNEVFPIAAHNKRFAGFDAGADPKFVAAFRHAGTARQIATNLFGKTRVRKDLVRAIGDHKLTPAALEVAWSMRGLVATDHLVAFLTASGSTLGHVAPAPLHLRRVFARMDPRPLVRLLRTAPDDWNGWCGVRDTARMVEAGNDLRTPTEELDAVRTWDDLHYVLVRHRHRSDARSGAGRIKTSTELKWLSSAARGDLTFKVAADRRTLVDWGDQLHNCIASYFGHAQRSDLALIGISQGGKLIAAAGVDRIAGSTGEDQFELSQLLGRFNQPLPEPDRRLIEAVFADGGIRIPADYLGSRPRQAA